MASELPQLTLYVAGDLPNSRRALAHLSAWLKESSIPRENVKIVDVLQQPQLAAENDIFITPALVFSGTGSTQVFLGDLSDTPLDTLRPVSVESHEDS